MPIVIDENSDRNSYILSEKDNEDDFDFNPTDPNR